MEEWYAHYQLRPWGGAADDERLAFLLMNVVQALTGGKSLDPSQAPPDPSHTPWEMRDFLLHQLAEDDGLATINADQAAEAAGMHNFDALDRYGWTPIDEG